jgi:hypothetical protein
MTATRRDPKKETSMTKTALIALALPVLVAGCADLTPGQQRALTGGAIGTAGGAALGAIGGNAGLGAIAGGVAGVAGGLIYNHVKENEQSAYQQGYYAGKHKQPANYQ